MIKLIISFVLYGVMFWIINTYLPESIFGFKVLSGGLLGYIVLGAIFFLVQKIIKPVISFLALPANILTLGLFGIVVNICIIYLFRFLINSTDLVSIQIGNLLQIFLLSILLSFFYKIMDAIA